MCVYPSPRSQVLPIAYVHKVNHAVAIVLAPTRRITVCPPRYSPSLLNCMYRSLFACFVFSTNIGQTMYNIALYVCYDVYIRFGAHDVISECATGIAMFGYKIIKEWYIGTCIIDAVFTT